MTSPRLLESLERPTVCWGNELHELATPSVAAWGAARPNSLRPRGPARAAPTSKGLERRAVKPIGVLARVALPCLLLSCNTAGSSWMAQPLDGELSSLPPLEEAAPPASTAAPPRSARTRVIREERATEAGVASELGAGSGFTQASAPRSAASGKLEGRVLGTFKNTYYDFPSEGDFEGEPLELMNAACRPIANVPRGFYESVCVQGSGTLKAGGTVSFAKRDCSCAAECPRTGQRICFDLLDKGRFPWGRGATGKSITPLLTVAVDSVLIPLGTSLYIPEYDGVARDPSGATRHDGCFIAEDRGLAVKGEHVDIFTGYREITRLWNRLVPSNSGVTVVAESPRCRRAP